MHCRWLLGCLYSASAVSISTNGAGGTLPDQGGSPIRSAPTATGVAEPQGRILCRLTSNHCHRRPDAPHDVVDGQNERALVVVVCPEFGASSVPIAGGVRSILVLPAAGMAANVRLFHMRLAAAPDLARGFAVTGVFGWRCYWA
jgi:hypothetical protein